MKTILRMADSVKGFLFCVVFCPERVLLSRIVPWPPVLEAIADSEGGLTLSAIAARCALLKSSAFRILFTLSELGYVERINSGGA